MIIITSHHEETERYVFCKHSTGGFFVFKENLIQVAVQPVEMEIAQEMFLPKVVI